MQLEKKILELYKQIDFYNRFETLSELYQFENRFENYSNEEVIKIIEDLGYKVKFIKKEKFFKIEEKKNELEFSFHISLKYGKAELILGADGENITTAIGGPFTFISKLIEIAENKEKEGYTRDPRFRNYDDLKKILKEAFCIYEDFKKEVLKTFLGRGKSIVQEGE